MKYDKEKKSSNKISIFLSNAFYSVDTFESHLGVLYCKLHFKSLFSPKAVEDTEPGKRKRTEFKEKENLFEKSKSSFTVFLFC